MGSIENWGIITGDVGVWVEGGTTTLTNYGTITGLLGEAVILGIPVFDVNSYILENYGSIIGIGDGFTPAVSMGDGDDSVTLWTGSQIVDGDIATGGGDDVLTMWTGSQFINGNFDGEADIDTLNLDGDGFGSVTWDVSSFEALNKDGSGRWTLETDLDLGPSGITVVNTGDLGLNATLTSSSGVTVNASGTLSGNGFITGNIANNGTISPGNGSASPFGTLDVTGTVSFAAGTTLAVDIGALGTRDRLVVSGTATADGTIQVNEVTAIPGGEVIDVITASSLVNLLVGDPIYNTSLVVSFSSQDDGSNLGILTTRLPYSNFADTDNQREVAEAMYDSVGLSADDLGRVLAHLDFLPLQDLQNAFEELQPKPYATHPGLMLQEANFFRSNLTDRLRDRRQELFDSFSGTIAVNSESSISPSHFAPSLLDSTADVSETVALSGEQSRWRIYAQSYIRWTEEKPDTSVDGFDAFTFGTFFGTDGRLGQKLIGGLCLGTSVTEMDNSGGGGNKLSLRFGPYFSYCWDRFILEGSVTGSANWLSNQRSIDITGLSRSAEGSYDSYDLAAELAALYEIKSWGLTLAPELRLKYDYIYLDDFQETGADSISLIVFDRRVHSLHHTIGGRLSYDIEFAKSFLRPEAWVAWTHKYLDDEQAVQAAFTGAPQNDFTINAPGAPREILQWGAGLTLSLAGTANTYLLYQAEIYQDTWNHGVQGGFRFQF
jgi:uncharacterized protein with beta-barrel porin domain